MKNFIEAFSHLFQAFVIVLTCGLVYAGVIRILFGG